MQTVFDADGVEQARGAAVEVGIHNQVRAGLEQLHQRGNRRHAAGESDGVRAAFQRAICSGVDAFSVVANGEALKPHIYQLVSEIEEICGRTAVKVSEGISLVACVSRRMVFRPGISGRLFAALGENRINIRMIAQGAEELTILMGVADADFERTIKVLYDSFTRRN